MSVPPEYQHIPFDALWILQFVEHMANTCDQHSQNKDDDWFHRGQAFWLTRNAIYDYYADKTQP